MTQSARITGTGLATTGLIGAGIGTGIVYSALIFSYANLVVALVLVAVIIGVICTVYYLVIILTMLFDKYESKKHSYLSAFIYILTLLILLFILIPNELLSLKDILSITSYSDSIISLEHQVGFSVTIKSNGLLIITPNNKLSDIISNLSNSMYDPVISNSGANTLLDNGTIKMHKYMAYSPESQMKGLKAQTGRLSFYKDYPLAQGFSFKADALNFNLNLLFNPYASFSQDIIAFPLSISQNTNSYLGQALVQNNANTIMVFVRDYLASNNVSRLLDVIEALIAAEYFDTLFTIFKLITDNRDMGLIDRIIEVLIQQNQAGDLTEFVRFLLASVISSNVAGDPGHGYFELMDLIINRVPDNIRITIAAPVTEHIAGLLNTLRTLINESWASFIQRTIAGFLEYYSDNQTLDTFDLYFRAHHLAFIEPNNELNSLITDNLEDIVIYRVILENFGVQNLFGSRNISLVTVTPEQLWYLEIQGAGVLDTDVIVPGISPADIADVILLLWNQYNNRNI